ncbi:sigma factor [Catellatospora coxensis]
MHPEFEDYVRARSGPLVGFAYLLCRDRHLAEDLVQEVLAKAYHRWDRIEADNPDAYLRKAVVWAHSSWWRRLSHRERPLETTPTPRATTTSCSGTRCATSCGRCWGRCPAASARCWCCASSRTSTTSASPS